jgi:hypothetical protein
LTFENNVVERYWKKIIRACVKASRQNPNTDHIERPTGR